MSEKHPAPTRADHRRFCAVEGWRVVRDATGRKARHHVTLELELEDGRTLRTRISHPVGADTVTDFVVALVAPPLSVTVSVTL